VIETNKLEKSTKNRVDNVIFLNYKRKEVTMSKDTTYSLRINSKLKEALAVAAKRDRRIVASMLKK